MWGLIHITQLLYIFAANRRSNGLVLKVISILPLVFPAKINNIILKFIAANSLHVSDYR
jgi:hypothetical protein